MNRYFLALFLSCSLLLTAAQSETGDSCVTNLWKLLASRETEYRTTVADGSVREPQLIFDNRHTIDVVKDLLTPDTLIVTSEFDLPALKGLTGVQIVTVDHITIESAAHIREKYKFKRVIGIGGGTPLDMAKAISAGKPIDVVPTILSTACISVNKTIARDGGHAHAVVSETPEKVIVPLASILEQPPALQKQMSQSGYGDVFARVSAAMDTAHRAGKMSYETIVANTPPKIYAGLQWVMHDFKGYDERALRLVAELSNEASTEIVRRGSSEGANGAEHTFYYKLLEIYPEMEKHVPPTHGQLVAVGTLVSARIVAEETGDYRIFDELKLAFDHLGLPTTEQGLHDIHLTREQVAEGMKTLVGSNTVPGAYFAKHDMSILKTVFP